jgi:hypothetical protein
MLASSTEGDKPFFSDAGAPVVHPGDVRGGGSGSSGRTDAPPLRSFCTPAETAVFLGLPYDAIRKRIQRGTMFGVAKTIEGELWRPDGTFPSTDRSRHDP